MELPPPPLDGDAELASRAEATRTRAGRQWARAGCPRLYRPFANYVFDGSREEALLGRDCDADPGYRLVRYLGSGSYGVAWLAERASDRAPLVVKFQNGDEEQEILQREVDVMCRLTQAREEGLTVHVPLLESFRWCEGPPPPEAGIIESANWKSTIAIAMTYFARTRTLDRVAMTALLEEEGPLVLDDAVVFDILYAVVAAALCGAYIAYDRNVANVLEGAAERPRLYRILLPGEAGEAPAQRLLLFHSTRIAYQIDFGFEQVGEPADAGTRAGNVFSPVGASTTPAELIGTFPHTRQAGKALRALARSETLGEAWRAVLDAFAPLYGATEREALALLARGPDAATVMTMALPAAGDGARRGPCGERAACTDAARPFLYAAPGDDAEPCCHAVPPPGEWARVVVDGAVAWAGPIREKTTGGLALGRPDRAPRARFEPLRFDGPGRRKRLPRLKFAHLAEPVRFPDGCRIRADKSDARVSRLEWYPFAEGGLDLELAKLHASEGKWTIRLLGGDAALVFSHAALEESLPREGARRGATLVLRKFAIVRIDAAAKETLMKKQQKKAVA